MIPLRARLIARRHEALVGRPVRAWRVSTGPGLPLILLGIFLGIGAVSALSPFDGTALKIVLQVLLGIVLLGAYLLVIDPRLVVCERGVILGRLVPGLPLSPTYVIGGGELDPRTVCVVRSGPVTARELGLPSFFFRFFAYAGSPGVPSVLFTGPWNASTSRDAASRRPTRGSFYLFAQRDARGVADALLHMIGRCGGIPAGFRPVADLQPIPVTGRREDAVRQLPGAVPPGTHRAV